MEQPVCPQCGAAIEDDLLASTGSTACPFCGAETSSTEPGSVSNDQTAPKPAVPSTPTQTAGNAKLPLESRIEVIEAGEQRLVLHIPATGKRTKSLGRFVAFWLVFMCLFTPPWFIGIGKGNGPPMLFIVPFLTLFWMVGFGLLYVWACMRYTRTLLLLERDRLAIQNQFFNRKRNIETGLTHDSRAQLVESYRVNDEPIYSVVINGRDDVGKFGAALSRPEKDWLVHTINAFLGTEAANDDDAPTEINAAVNQTTIERVPNLAPEELPADSMVQVLDSEHDRLVLQIPGVPRGTARGCLTALFGPGWILPTAFFAWHIVQHLNGQGGGLGVAMLIVIALELPFVVLPFLVLMFVYRGKQTVEITSDSLSTRWHLGWLGFCRQFATTAVTDVVVANLMNEKRMKSGRQRRRDPLGDHRRCCAAFAGERMLPLTTVHTNNTAREMAGLVRHQFSRMGFELPHE